MPSLQTPLKWIAPARNMFDQKKILILRNTEVYFALRLTLIFARCYVIKVERGISNIHVEVIAKVWHLLLLCIEKTSKFSQE